MRQIDEVHQPEDHRQANRHQKHQHGKLKRDQPPQHLEAEIGLHGVSSPSGKALP
ncbi:hypothetical protein [Paracoccus sp. MC1862]|uniref:hypothetical protein n=1 Tax=Paracoccus sp. MC1862 TaxID=2760307 RepID=UPI001F330182|nr:hypothetical protein [Paracoccus sp. MC1862]